MPQLPPIQMLWVQGSLSILEQLSITSFLRCGHPVNLYTYGLDTPPPEGTRLIDACEIAPESSLFLSPSMIGQGSLAPFSDIFRYKLLFERGGIWCDTDMVCLRPLSFAAKMDLFFSSEYARGSVAGDQKLMAKANIGAIKVPAGHPIIADCLEQASRIDLASAEWAKTGPGIVGDILAKRGRYDAILHPDIFCSIPHWSLPELVSGFRMINPGAYAIHFWNEIWRWNFMDKNQPYDSLSIFERLKRHYLPISSQ